MNRYVIILPNKHNINPINNYLLFTWVAVSILGLYSTTIIEFLLEKTIN